MKKTFITAFLTAMMILVPSMLISANEKNPEKEYSISAIDLTVSVTEDLNVLTRNVSEGNPALEILDAEPIALQNSYLQNHIYLDAFPDDLSYEIIVTATDIHNDDAKNFSDLNENDFAEYCEKLKSGYAEGGHEELLSMEIYQNDVTKYVYTYTHSTLNDVSSYIARYYTVMNGRNYNFTLQTNDLEITDELDSQLQSIVDSAQYAKVKSSITESGLFMELYETLIGFGLTVLILGTILFLLIRSSKKPH